MSIGEKLCAGAIFLIILAAFVTLVLGVLSRPSEPPDEQ